MKAREKEKQMLAGRAVRLREETQAFRLGKVTAAAFYITLAGAFGAKRQTMIPKVLNLRFALCVERERTRKRGRFIRHPPLGLFA